MIAPALSPSRRMPERFNRAVSAWRVAESEVGIPLGKAARVVSSRRSGTVLGFKDTEAPRGGGRQTVSHFSMAVCRPVVNSPIVSVAVHRGRIMSGGVPEWWSGPASRIGVDVARFGRIDRTK